MKNTIKKLTLFALVAFSFTACNDRNRTPENSNLQFSSAKSEFFGDPARKSIDFYDLYLYDRDLTSNPNGDGLFIYLQLNTGTTNENEIVSGTYNVNNSSQANKFTFDPGAWRTDSQGDYLVGSYVGKYKGSQTLKYPITNGKFTVSRNGNYYNVSGAIVADGQQYDISYQGQISLTDMVVPLPETLTHGEIWYHGNVSGKNVKLYSIRLGANDVKISNFSGNGDALQIEIYTPITATTIIPDGTYPVKVDQVQAYTAIDGYYDADSKADYGTWYYTADALSVNQGFVKTQYMTGSTYKLDFNFTDDYYGYNFGAVYQGELAFVNKTNSPIAVRSAVRSSAKSNPDNQIRRGELKRRFTPNLERSSIISSREAAQKTKQPIRTKQR